MYLLLVKLEKIPKEKEFLSSFEKFILKKCKKEIALNMLKNNEPIENVCSYTSLSKKEVEKLNKDLK